MKTVARTLVLLGALLGAAAGATGADPRRKDFGHVVNRVDMPQVGDELHHVGCSSDQRRLLVPGLFSNRIHVFGSHADGRCMTLRAVDEQLAARSGYVVPHSVIAIGPWPARRAAELGPKSMYDFDALDEVRSDISTTFGPPALRGARIAPACLGDEVAVRDHMLRLSPDNRRP